MGKLFFKDHYSFNQNVFNAFYSPFYFNILDYDNFERITDEEEKEFFLRYNYAKKQYNKTNSDFWLEYSVLIRNIIAKKYIKYVRLLAKKYSSKFNEKLDLYPEFYSDNYLLLLSLIDYFDVSKDIPFVAFVKTMTYRNMKKSWVKKYYKDYMNYKLTLKESHKSIQEIKNVDESIINKNLVEVLLFKNTDLNANEIYIVTKTFGINTKAKTHSEIAKSRNVSRQVVNKVYNRALKKIKEKALAYN